MENLRFSASCLFGLEGPLSQEIKDIGASDVEAYDGRVCFSGGWDIAARANLWLRTAERVEIVLGEFDARSFDELFEGTKALCWERFIGEKDAFPVSGWALKSTLYSVPDCQSIIKKAIVDRLAAIYSIRRFEESGSVHAVRFAILKDRAVLMLDTSGEGLHKRGYRENSSIAPLKETLAAGIVALSRPYGDSVIYDPFCGSGTIAIEAALMLCNIAPGIKRFFAAEKWAVSNADVWRAERERALSLVDTATGFEIYASDIDPGCCELTRRNASLAGVGSRIRVKQADINDFEYLSQRAVVITNPPYGERLLDLDAARVLEKAAGRVLTRENGRKVNVISSDEEFERFFGAKADKRRKLYNGMLKCQLYMYFRTRDPR